MSNQIKMTKADVWIAQVEDEVCENNGENCTFSVSHQLHIELRAIGTGIIPIGRYCETCATELAKRIQASLPDDDEEQ